mmetsp:Transcript_52322/g.124894  ORF Transcript_52322/g.124894 Transcript_52322/m.124894 type:complete len:115 (+) Transcript_52322:2801-3145(+)
MSSRAKPELMLASVRLHAAAGDNPPRCSLSLTRCGDRPRARPKQENVWTPSAEQRRLHFEMELDDGAGGWVLEKKEIHTLHRLPWKTIRRRLLCLNLLYSNVSVLGLHWHLALA